MRQPIRFAHSVSTLAPPAVKLPPAITCGAAALIAPLPQSATGNGWDYDLAVIVPLRARSDRDVEELAAYYSTFIGQQRDFSLQLLVPDNSTEKRFARMSELLGCGPADHFRPEPTFLGGQNNKLNNVHAALARTRARYVSVFDNDARPNDMVLRAILCALRAHEFVRVMVTFDRPNIYDWVDLSGIFVINELLPQKQFWGNVNFQREFISLADFPAKDGLFDELVLERHCLSRGGRVRYLSTPQLHMTGGSRSLAVFGEQRIRYAYENLALLRRTVFFASLLPALVALAVLGGAPIALSAAIALTSALWIAAVRGARHYGSCATDRRAWVLAPAWFWPYALTTWLAIATWCCGGVRFGGRRIRRAA